MKRTTPLIVGVMSVMLCLVSACSPGASSKLDNSVIRIGSIGSFSGPLGSSTSKMGEVLKAWVAWTNAHGGVNGRQIKLYLEDDGGNATTAVTKVKSLIENDKVVAIVSDMSYADTIWAPIAQKAGIPVLGGQGKNAPFVTNPYFFSTTSGAAASSYGLMATAKANGPSVATVYCAEAPVCKGAAKADASLGEPTGTDVVYSGFPSATAADYTTECQAIKNSNAQSVILGVAASTLIRVMRTCIEQGVTAQPVLTGSTASQAVFTSPDMKNFAVVDSVFPFFDKSTPATKDFQTAIKQYAPDLGDQWGPLPAIVWTAGKLFEAAVKASGADEVTSASILDGLYALPKGTTLGGLTAPLTFTKGSARPTPVNCYFTWGVKNGELYEPQGLKPNCAPIDVIEAFNHAAY